MFFVGERLSGASIGDESKFASRDRCARATLAVVLAALAFGAAGIPAAAAADLFTPDGAEKKPNPWFGATVDKFYEETRAKWFDPAKAAALRIIESETAQSALDSADLALRHFAETARKGAGAPAAGEISSLLSKPAVTRTYAAAEVSLNRLGASVKEHIIEPWNRAAEALDKPDQGVLPQVALPMSAVEPTPTAGPLHLAAMPQIQIPETVGPGPFVNNDPFERINRAIFGFNRRFRLNILDPMATFYFRSTTAQVRNGVRNFFHNLREPVTIASSLIEGHLVNARDATARFGINTVMGIGGVLDPAAQMGYPARPRDLEHTLCVAGLPSGPYLVLPILGPATVRDAAGRIGTVVVYYEVMGAAIYIPYRVSDLALQYVDLRDRIGFVNSISIDPYVAQKMLYLTTRSMNCGDQAAADKEFFTR